MSLSKYILFCLSSLAIACGTDPGQTKAEIRSDSFTDTISNLIPAQKKRTGPPSLQQKVLDWYLSHRKGDSLNTIMDSRVVTFDSLRHSIYADTVLYPFADLEFIKIKGAGWLISVADPNVKPDPAVSQNNYVELPAVVSVLPADAFLKERKKFALGDVHLTFSKVLFYQGNYYVQVWRLMNEELNFYNILDTFRFNAKGELAYYFDEGKYPSSYSETDAFLETMKKPPVIR
jgi:hypothetical protein